MVAADVTPRTGLTLADRVGAGPEWLMTALAAVAWLFAFLLARRRRRAHPVADQSGKVAVSAGGPVSMVEAEQAGDHGDESKAGPDGAGGAKTETVEARTEESRKAPA